MLNPHIEASLSAFKARLAATADLSTKPPFVNTTPRCVNAARPLPRTQRVEPRRSRQYTQRMATTAVRDQRLTMGARNLATLISAVTGKGISAATTRGYLAAQLGVTVRSIARYLVELRAYGYIVTDHVNAPNGKTLSLHVEVCEPLLPYQWTQPLLVMEGVTAGTEKQRESSLKDSRAITAPPPAPRKRTPRCGLARDAARPRPGRRP
jgi:hypothetical protein